MERARPTAPHPTEANHSRLNMNMKVHTARMALGHVAPGSDIEARQGACGQYTLPVPSGLWVGTQHDDPESAHRPQTLAEPAYTSLTSMAKPKWPRLMSTPAIQQQYAMDARDARARRKLTSHHPPGRLLRASPDMNASLERGCITSARQGCLGLQLQLTLRVGKRHQQAQRARGRGRQRHEVAIPAVRCNDV